MILLIDNYDSFSFNLYQYVGELTNGAVRVVRNDELTLDEIEALHPDAIVVSPGPGRPADAGICENAIRRFAPTIPILGVCLGCQAIGEAFGGRIVYAKKTAHGKSSRVAIDPNSPIFRELPNEIECARYHSLAVEADSLPDELTILGKTIDDGEIMALKHKRHNVYGLQFHPESILTPRGKEIVANFLKLAADAKASKDDVLRNSTVGTPRAVRSEDDLRSFIEKLKRKVDLTREEAQFATDIITNDDANVADDTICDYLAALSAKGETADEIVGTARSVRGSTALIPWNGELLDVVGTGGDSANAFNISTISAFVVASSGFSVAKYGARASSSQCGSADCLESLGANVELPTDATLEILRDANFCFLHARRYRPAFAKVARARKKYGKRSIFNVVGPLTNPLAITRAVIGVYDRALVELVVDAARELGIKRGAVVFGTDRLDEISVSAPTFVREFDEKTVESYLIEPEELVARRYDRSAIRGGGPSENAAILRAILGGVERGAKRDAAIANAGFGLYIAGKAPSLADGADLAANLIDSGAAAQLLNFYVERTRNFGKN